MISTMHEPMEWRDGATLVGFGVLHLRPPRRAPPAPGRGLVWLAGSYAAAHVRRHRWLPSLLQPPLPSSSDARRSRRWRSWRRPRVRRACCGGPPIIATITVIPTVEPTCTRRAHGFWWSHVGWILSDAPRRLRPGTRRRLRALSGTALARSPSLGADRGVCARRSTRSAASRRSLWGFLSRRCCSTTHVRHQLGGAPLGHAPVRDRRRQPQQLVAGAADPGRGLAQQPPLLPCRAARHGVRWWEIDVTWLGCVRSRRSASPAICGDFVRRARRTA